MGFALDAGRRRARAGAHELLPSIAAHPDSLRHTFRVVRAERWIDREEHTDDAS